MGKINRDHNNVSCDTHILLNLYNSFLSNTFSLLYEASLHFIIKTFTLPFPILNVLTEEQLMDKYF